MKTFLFDSPANPMERIRISPLDDMINIMSELPIEFAGSLEGTLDIDSVESHQIEFSTFYFQRVDSSVQSPS
jgi:hypothetical protein